MADMYIVNMSYKKAEETFADWGYGLFGKRRNADENNGDG